LSWSLLFLSADSPSWLHLSSYAVREFRSAFHWFLGCLRLEQLLDMSLYYFSILGSKFKPQTCVSSGLGFCIPRYRKTFSLSACAGSFVVSLSYLSYSCLSVGMSV
jgi:hypothetical protein